MYRSLTFDLGASLELEGCKSCYHKTKNEVYYPEIGFTTNHCKTCVYDPRLVCGRFVPALLKVREYEDEKDRCLIVDELVAAAVGDQLFFINSNDSKNTFVLSTQNKTKVDQCDELNDECCISQIKENRIENPIQKLDPTKLFFPCHSITNEIDFCVVSGKASGSYCGSFLKDSNFSQLFQKRFIHVATSTMNEKIFFYPYSRSSQNIVMEENNHSILDPNVECGILIYRHNNTMDKLLKPGIQKYERYYNEDSCLMHLRSLHLSTSITDLKQWREKTEYLAGVGLKVGGLTCRLLQIYGTSIMIPILLNLAFNTVLFVNDLKNQKANVLEVVPLIFLFYPQYKTLKFLAQYLFIHSDEKILTQDKEENDRTVAPLEPFLESCLQVKPKLIFKIASCYHIKKRLFYWSLNIVHYLCFRVCMTINLQYFVSLPRNQLLFCI